jgi:hypothetical protein
LSNTIQNIIFFDLFGWNEVYKFKIDFAYWTQSVISIDIIDKYNHISNFQNFQNISNKLKILITSEDHKKYRQKN